MTPLTHRIAYTRHSDGGVTICQPTAWAMGLMTGGGGMWADQPRGYLDELVRRKTCPILQKGAPCSERAAWRMVKALRWGGLTTAEAWDTIRAHDCERFGHSETLISFDDLPDRWFRDAWTRERSNSGVPYVDVEKARAIQWQKLQAAVSRENKRRELDLFGLPPISLQKITYQSAIKNARDADELRRVWPEELQQP